MLDPLPMTESVGDRLLEAVDRRVGEAQDRIGAGDVVEHRRVVGVHGDRALGPLAGAGAVAQRRQRAGGEVERAGVVGVALQLLLGELQGLAL